RQARDALRRRSPGGPLPPALARRARGRRPRLRLAGRRLRLQLKRLSLAAAVLLPGLGGCGSARADDYLALRRAPYPAASPRVIQPMVEIERDSPGDGVDVTAHFLVDAITSASASAGVGVDALFTEVRNDAGLTLRKRWERTEATLGYRYSAESDYWSHSF